MPRGALHELLDPARVQAAEVQPGDTALPAEVGQHVGQRMAAVEVGVAVGGQDEHPHRRDRAQEVAQQEQRRLVGPVQVVEHEDDRGVVRAGGQQVGDGLEQAVALGVGLGLQRLGQAGDPGAELGQQPGELARQGAQLGPQPVGGDRRGVAPQRLREGLEGGAQLRVAAAPEDGAALVVGDADGLGDQPGLADAGLAGDQHQAALARRRPPSTPTPARPARPPPGEGEDRAPSRRPRAAGAPASSTAGRPDHLAHRDRLGEALELARTEGAELVVGPGAGQGPHEVADQDLAALGRARRGGTLR